jgi:glycosyltransferase involved in cell wall biosynthesis
MLTSGAIDIRRILIDARMRGVPEVTFSVIVPTLGRPSLNETLASVVGQLEPGDEVLVRCSNDQDFGNAARQSLIERARGTHLVFIDDDDQFARGALETMRRFAREHPGRIGIFRMRYDNGLVIWTEPVVRLGNLGSPMLCIPNTPGGLGRWESPEIPRHGDLAFLRSAAALQGDPIFRTEIVAFIRADRRLVRRTVIRLRKLPVRIRYHARRTRLRRVASPFRKRS